MPRARRAVDETIVSPVLQQMQETLAVIDRSRLIESGMTITELEAEKAREAAKWQRREAKAVAKWRRMTILEQRAWADDYLAERRGRDHAEAKMPKAADLPYLFAVTTIVARDAAKAAKRQAKNPPKDYYAAQLAASAPGRTRPSPEPEEVAAAVESPEPPKPRKKRRGPAYGVVGHQVEGVMHWYDERGDHD